MLICNQQTTAPLEGDQVPHRPAETQNSAPYYCWVVLTLETEEHTVRKVFMSFSTEQGSWIFLSSLMLGFLYGTTNFGSDLFVSDWRSSVMTSALRCSSVCLSLVWVYQSLSNSS
ncbi:hypothetical protein AMECASPLE_026677 [Ameca splendens]|uniref:Uncharacterized protein n=1 Tax=Ameca splendens TaxID=208324 RepID=A0ABV0XHX6_9TELE